MPQLREYGKLHAGSLLARCIASIGSAIRGILYGAVRHAQGGGDGAGSDKTVDHGMMSFLIVCIENRSIIIPQRRTSDKYSSCKSPGSAASGQERVKKVFLTRSQTKTALLGFRRNKLRILRLAASGRAHPLLLLLLSETRTASLGSRSVPTGLHPAARIICVPLAHKFHFDASLCISST